jgi:hypothetical protein
VLAADAESDWDPYAKHPTDDTWGLFQQNPRWWGTKDQILDPAYATTSFVLGRSGTPGLRKITITDDAPLDCWRIQGWGRRPDGSHLNPDGGKAGYAEWLAHPSTQNYVRRLPNIPKLIGAGYGRSPYGKNYGG